MKRFFIITMVLGAMSPGIRAEDDAVSTAGMTDLAAWRDPAMSSMVDFNLLGEALSSSDAAGVTDVALQLAEAERVLFRSHAKVTSVGLLQIAVKIAQNQDDQDTLKRIQKVAQANGNKELSSELAAAAALGGASRAVIPPPEMTIEADPVVISEAQEVKAQIELAENTGDAKSLKELTKVIEASEFPETVATWLNALVARAKKSVGDGAGDDARALTLLADASRWGGYTSPGISSAPRFPLPVPPVNFFPTPREPESNLGGPSGLVHPGNGGGRRKIRTSSGERTIRRQPRWDSRYRNGSRQGGKNLGTFNINAYRQNRFGY